MTSGHTWAFGRFRLDTGARVLFRDEKRIALTPKAVDVLVTLIESRGTPVGREELFRAVWSDAAVEDGTLSSHISLLRKTLGGEFIETIPKRGYRFVGEVDECGERRALLAVLPFENLGGNRKDDSLSDGLTEEMITQLGRLNPARLGVIARTSSMTYKSTDKTVAQIGRELGVEYVLEGSVRRAANRVRIAAQLIQVRDQTHLWSESYESELQDILALQSRVAAAVAEQIQIRLLPNEQARLENARQVVPAAYEAYLKGRYLWNRRSIRDLQMSMAAFEEAIGHDPDYAPAYAGLADAYLTLADHDQLSQSEAMERARPLLLKAVELDDELGEAHTSLGHAALHQFDWPAAERELSRGIALNPTYSIGRHYYANYLLAVGRLGEAFAEGEHAVRLDPVSPAVHSNLAGIAWFNGDSRRAIEEATKAMDLNPSYSRAYEDLGRAYEQMGDFGRAIELFRNAASLGEQADGTLASLAHAYALAGKREEAEEILRQLEEIAKTRFVTAYSFALICLGLGQLDAVFAHLDRAFEERSSALPFIAVNPRWVRLRGDERFARLLRRVFSAS